MEYIRTIYFLVESQVMRKMGRMKIILSFCLLVGATKINGQY